MAVGRPRRALRFDDASLTCAVRARDVDVSIEVISVRLVPVVALERDVRTVGRPTRGVGVTDQPSSALARTLDDPDVVPADERQPFAVPRPVRCVGVANYPLLRSAVEIFDPEIAPANERNRPARRGPVRTYSVPNKQPILGRAVDGHRSNGRDHFAPLIGDSAP